MTKIRQYFYLLAGVVAGLLPLLSAFGAITADQAVSITDLFNNAGSLLGGTAAVTAGVILSRQRKDGTVDSPELSAVEQAVNAIPVVVQKAADAAADLERLKQAAADAIGNVPVYGDEAKAIIEALPRF